MKLLEDDIWPIVVIFCVYIGVYAVGAIADLLGYSVRSRVLNGIIGGAIVAVLILFIFQDRISRYFSDDSLP